MQILEPKPKDKMPELNEQDAALWKEATKRYNKLKLMEHRVWQLDLSTKIKLKNAALAALPVSLLILNMASWQDHSASRMAWRHGQQQ